MPSDPASNPSASCFNIPATARARGNSANNTLASEAREAGEHVQHSIDIWIGDAQTVLIFVSPVQPFN